MNIKEKIKKNTELTPLRHGGNLSDAIQEFGGQRDDWVDLSTGISPWPYPIPSINESLWHSLPPNQEALLTAAAHYYDCDATNITVTPGSQLAIRLIPTLIESNQTVAVPFIGYQEHAHAWQSAGHSVIRYRSKNELVELITNQNVNNAVVINPNNPTHETFAVNELKFLAKQLSGMLLVDEAFIDLDPINSLTNNLSSDTDLNNTVVLRSIGKFFGLAGARIGFVITQNYIGHELAKLLHPWSINAPAQQLVETALNDTEWQKRQCIRIKLQAIELNELLIETIDQSENITFHRCEGLFATIFGNQITIGEIHIHLAKNKLWTRLGDPYTDPQQESEQNWLRLSLPGDNFDLLANSLKQFS